MEVAWVWSIEECAKVGEGFAGRGSGAVESVAYSPDGEVIAIGTNEGLCLWRGERGIGVDYLGIWRVAEFGEEGHVNGVAYGPMAGGLPSGSGDGAIREWNAETGAMLAVFADIRRRLRSVAYSPDGRWIASGTEDATVRVWDTESATEAVLRGDEGNITSVAYSPDGRRIAVANSWSLQHYTARMFDAESGRRLPRSAHTETP